MLINVDNNNGDGSIDHDHTCLFLSLTVGGYGGGGHGVGPGGLQPGGVVPGGLGIAGMKI